MSFRDRQSTAILRRLACPESDGLVPRSHDIRILQNLPARTTR